jgi:predicted O-linked N-acetylglucosamine transferase (SPINDLY family)
MTPPEADYSTILLDAWHGRLQFGQLVDYAGGLGERGQSPLAVVLYQTWLQRNQTTYNHFAYFNLGVLLSNAGDLHGAKEAYLRAIQLAPDFVQPHFNLGMIYERLGQIDAAIAEWRWVDDHVSPDQTDNRPVLLMALNGLGRVQDEHKHYYSAHGYLSKSLAIEPLQPDVLHHYVFLRQRQCVWPVYASLAGVSPDLMRESTSALATLSLSDDPEDQLKAARRYVTKKVRSNVKVLTPQRPYHHDRIRVGYCSSDFCMHPVAMLTVELFECHDREKFEVYGYCWTREGDSPLRQRVIKAMDHFERIDSLSDEAAARLIRDQEIDILVDLHGQTLGARADMLAFRPAPIQVTYLGLPATTGLPSIDYVIADRYLIHEDEAVFYSEKPIIMPDVYMVSDRKRPVAPIPNRSDCNLPDKGFVFCSFNNNYKYTPEMFDTWMNILRRVPGSVMWLLADNPWAEVNLKNEAQARGIDVNRLIFAPRVLPDQYLSRYALADLFLDCFPFNAGTTANDALWMGLPVLTRSGRSFSSRMAGALLTAANLSELITDNQRDYEEQAVKLAQNPDQCRRLREHLREVRTTGVLFDTPRFVRHLEEHFRKLVADLG